MSCAVTLLRIPAWAAPVSFARRDLFDLAIEIGQTEHALKDIYRTFRDAVADETDPVSAGTSVLAELIDARNRLSRIIVELHEKTKGNASTTTESFSR